MGRKARANNAAGGRGCSIMHDGPAFTLFPGRLAADRTEQQDTR